MENPGAVTPATPAPPAATRAACPACGGGAASVQGYATLLGTATMAFPSLAVEKEFAQLLGNKNFNGFTDRQTINAILSKAEHRYVARRMCGQLILYGGGSSPAYILVPEDPRDLDLLVDTLKRPISATEFDVVKGRLAGMAPPALCNAQELPILVYSQLYSFRVETFAKSIPRTDRTKNVPGPDFERAAEETFHRIMRMASNGVGATRALTYAALSYAGLYELVAEKYAQNSSLSEIGVGQPVGNRDLADVRLKFVRRDTLFTETYRFTVNFSGPFEFLEEPLHPSYDFS
jgi:hypothetical protein